MSRSLRMLLAAGAGAATPGQEFASQPPVGTDVKIKQAWKDKGLKLMLIPGINDTGGTMREYVQGLSPSVLMPNLSSAPSNPYSTTPNGRVIRLDPANTDGTSAATVEFPANAVTSTNATVLWAGYVDALGAPNGVLVAKGADGSGNGWSLRLYQASATQLTADYVDTQPARISTTTTIPSTPAGTYIVVALRKNGSEISAWFDAPTRTGYAGGNSMLRQSGIGFSIGNAGDPGRTGSKTRCACLQVFDTGLVNADLESLLNNIWLPCTT